MNQAPRPVGGLILPGQGGKNVQRVRNAEGRVLPCCWSDCERDGDLRYKAVFRDPNPERPVKSTLTYVFCSPAHRALYLAGTDLQGVE